MDLLELNELDFFYWYWDFVLSTHIWAVSKIQDAKYALSLQQLSLRAEEDTQPLGEEGKTGKTKAKAKTKSKSKKEKEKEKEGDKDKDKEREREREREREPPSREPPSAEDTIYRARAVICKGIFRSMVLLTHARRPVVDKRESRYTTWPLRFEQRFKPLRWISNPPALSFADYLNTVHKFGYGSVDTPPTEGHVEAGAGGVEKETYEAATQRVAASIGQCFQTARLCLDEARKMKALEAAAAAAAAARGKGASAAVQPDANVLSLMKVTVASSIAVTKVEKVLLDWNSRAKGASMELEQDKRARVKIDRKYHRLYPVLDIVEE
jgi:hypothetical protein